MPSSQHAYEIRPRKDKRGVDLISDVLPFGRLWYGDPAAKSRMQSAYASLSIARGFIRQNTMNATAKKRIDYARETRGKMASETVLLLVLGLA
jgi:hypothetical protein